jgi:predicted DCC family thiol-disulfide oxidoreductase YuxK
VRFIIKWDKKNIFKLAALTSTFGRKFIEKYDVKADSIILVEDDKNFTKSNAVLKIMWLLPGLWKGIYLFSIIPAFIRDYGYDTIAKNRYRWFGKTNCVFVPNSEDKEKFLM